MSTSQISSLKAVTFEDPFGLPKQHSFWSLAYVDIRSLTDLSYGMYIQ